MARAWLALSIALLLGCDRASAPLPVPPSPLPSPSQVPSPSASPSPSVVMQRSPLPAGFVDLADVDDTILHDIRYHTAHNFVGRPIDGYREPLCLLTRQAAEALRDVQIAARRQGYTIKVYDCYRPLRAGEDFKRWGAVAGDDVMRAEFYPELTKSELFSRGYVSRGRSAHSRGSTIDLTLVALPVRAQRAYVAGEPLISCVAPQRFPDNTIDMGTGYDCFDTRSHTLDPRITGQARQNRLLLRQLMTEAGFRNYPNEWWHYGLVREPFPGTYFDFPVALG